MRKLNTKNKTYILALSFLVLLILVVVGIFIFNKIKDMNIRYDIDASSYVYNSKNELLHLNKTYAKKDLLGTYYVMDDDSKIEIGKTATILRKNTKEVQLLGNYYEIKDNGEIDKLSGENIVSSVIKPHYYKISDRKYLIIAPEIKSEDGSLNTNNYLLINIDKKGNAYLYNHEVNIKTFSLLKLISGEYVFNVNEETLAKNDQIINLAKINGSTNEYIASDNALGGGSGSGDGSASGEGGTGEGTGSGGGAGGSGSGSGGGAGSGSGSEGNGSEGTGTGATGNAGGGTTQVPEQETETIYTTKVEIDKVVSESYIYRKTTILEVNTDVTEAKINYVIYDPLDEYAGVYVAVYQVGGSLVDSYQLKKDETEFLVKDLEVATDYDFRFYYSYVDTKGETQNVTFDNVRVTTKSIKGEISLEKVSQKDVTYIVKIDNDFVLDSANISIYVDDQLVGTKSINTTSAASKNGFKDTFVYDFSGKHFVVLKISDCKYKNSNINIDATYKYKL